MTGFRWSTAPWQYPAASRHRLAPLWKAHDGQEHSASAGPLARDPQLAQLEAYLFATPEPLSIRRLTSLIKQATADDIKRQLKKLASLYDQQGSAWQLVELAGGYQLRTREAFLPWLLKLQPAATVHLSSAARETLAIVAYRQPINRADLEAIRGVSCMDVLRMLLEKNLIRIVGRDKTLGRPVQYGTTKQFLEMMGLKGLQELPPLKE